MKVAIGADHRGAEVLAHLNDLLLRSGYQVQASSRGNSVSCDYPDIAFPVAQAVARGEADRGVLICGSGIGMCIAANKVSGIRAALIHDEVGAEISRRHNDANVLCLAADMLGMRFIDRIVQTWLRTEFEGGRHARRVRKIAAIEQGIDPVTLGSGAGVVNASNQLPA
jgi:ribose 5-phosphate isomerase B